MNKYKKKFKFDFIVFVKILLRDFMLGLCRFCVLFGIKLIIIV